ncbi:MAG: CinA family protein [Candidatus Methanomethylophilus sp.]|nr:CinA family protein [Methanomethylophilus sp.]MDD3232981.1 CinA family protein [Methanomethylophilus sp.]MDD4222025.1 CinA family protein [Methanomethylophilus sp.]MDD4668798.1 CinA family protein [Methanomethylophilus sp.]
MNGTGAEAAAALAALAAERHFTVAAAESCTGGLIGASITARPGASEFFLGSAVTYANSAKEDLLGVPLGILIQYGAVSAQTARLMAAGARRLYRADYALAVTGIAGPGGATPGKPVGLVFIACAGPAGAAVRACHFTGDRAAVREQTVATALTFLTSFIRSSA